MLSPTIQVTLPIAIFLPAFLARAYYDADVTLQQWLHGLLGEFLLILPFLT